MWAGMGSCLGIHGARTKLAISLSCRTRPWFEAAPGMALTDRLTDPGQAWITEHGFKRKSIRPLLLLAQAQHQTGLDQGDLALLKGCT